MAQKTDVLLPDIGDFKDVEIIEILVNTGDRVEAEDPLITLESDKASIEIPSPHGGTVADIKVKVGDKVSEGDLILIMDTEGDADSAAAQEDGDRSEAAEMTEDAPGSVSEGDAAAPETSAASVESDAGDSGAAPETREVHLPDIGDFKDVEIIEVLVAAGDQVDAEQSLLTLESDKASMEIPAPFAGTVKSVEVKVGDRISEGDLIAAIETTGGGSSAGSAAASEPSTRVTDDAGSDAAQKDDGDAGDESQRPPGEKEQQRRPVMSRPDDATRRTAHASPGVRRFARELGVDLGLVSGSGPKGRITKEDVQAFVKRSLAGGAPASAAGGGVQLPAMPSVDFSKFGETEDKELGRIKKLSGAHLHRSWLNVPHVTQFDEADITELEDFRKAQKDAAAKADVKLTFMPFLMKALCKALAEFPQFNSSLSSEGEKLIMKKYTHIGVAVDTPNGLMVPVIRDVDKKGIFELAADLGEMGGKARGGKLAPDDMQGGCISISSLGGIGGVQFTPIVNAPEVAILGISRAEMKPKWDGKVFEPRLVMPFSLSYDHRVIDGAEGVRFTTYLSTLLGDIRRLLL